MSKICEKCGNEVFMGTIVLGGWAKGLVVRIGSQTQYGKIAQNASFIKPETEFEKGLSRFSSLMVKFILILTVFIFIVNAFLGKPLLNSLLFSLAIAVGLTPELLPVIVTVSLSHGAGKLSKKGVIAKQLVSIENLGNMDVLCTDKTGTLTEGKIVLVDTFPKNSVEVIQAALICNSATTKEHRKISGNPIDSAIIEYANHHSIKGNAGLAEVYEHPFDYEVKGMFTVAQNLNNPQQFVLFAKGAPEDIIAKSSADTDQKQILAAEFKQLSENGYRVLAISFGETIKKEKYSRAEKR
jgi:Mg2+-importing ATPase